MTLPPQPRIEREPDLRGVGRAWEVRADRTRPDQVAGVGTYLVHAPHGNVFWPWYLVACVHLRVLEGVRPPNLQFTEASHEYLFAAIDPRYYPTLDPDRGPEVAFLQPLDLVHQVANLSDAQALAVLKLTVRHIVHGASPDQDHRAYWRRTLDVTADHFREGRHKPEETSHDEGG